MSACAVCETSFHWIRFVCISCFGWLSFSRSPHGFWGPLLTSRSMRYWTEFFNHSFQRLSHTLLAIFFLFAALIYHTSVSLPSLTRLNAPHECATESRAFFTPFQVWISSAYAEHPPIEIHLYSALLTVCHSPATQANRKFFRTAHIAAKHFNYVYSSIHMSLLLSVTALPSALSRCWLNAGNKNMGGIL